LVEAQESEPSGGISNQAFKLITVRLARPQESDQIVTLLVEAANWLASQGIPMWQPSEIASDAIYDDVCQGLFFVAEHVKV
jgi:hypothetical protein